MKTKIKFTTIILLLTSGVFFSACGPGQLFGPTLTPTPTNTSTPTLTPTSTVTPSPTITPTVASTIPPAPDCLATSGKWESHETAEGFGAPTHIFTFTVSKCKITGWEIWVFPVPGELMWWPFSSSTIPITDNQFSHAEELDGGTFTIQGVFDSATSSHGTLDFPKGFSVFGTILTDDVSIPWTASPAK
jgi:hypothetical protein